VGPEPRSVRGWPVYVLGADALTAEVVPAKGGDLLSISTERGISLLWSTPWGLPERGSVPSGVDPNLAFLNAYPGGWQTIFPNGGEACTEYGVTWGFHGEAALRAWDVDLVTHTAIAMSTRLFRSPFRLEKRIALDGNVVTVTERATNEGSSAIEVMWSHHPAFGAPLIGPGCTVSTSARSFLADDVPLGEFGDLHAGAVAAWPFAEARDGGVVDLSRLPQEPAARLGYLSDFEDGARISLTNPEIGITVDLRWDETAMPYAWYWLEANGTPGFPWFGRAYVLGLEPATSYPGHGLGAVREKSASQISFQPGETKEIEISLTVSTAPATNA
jgi:galactose mutarotase-like enzyme